MTPAEADGVLFDGTTHCAEELPVAWSDATPPPEDAGDRNPMVLRLLTQLEEHLPENDDRGAAPSGDLARLEAKIELLLQLAGTLIAMQRPPPPRATLRLSSRGLVWHAPPPLASGAQGRLLLHLHPAVPYPLELAARVLARDDAVRPARAWVAFEALPEAVALLLERFTFRHHRRAVAGRRQARSVAGTA